MLHVLMVRILTQVTFNTALREQRQQVVSVQTRSQCVTCSMVFMRVASRFRFRNGPFLVCCTNRGKVELQDDRGILYCFDCMLFV